MRGRGAAPWLAAALLAAACAAEPGAPEATRGGRPAASAAGVDGPPAAAEAGDAAPLPTPARLVGGDSVYTVQRGDTLTGVSARFGAGVEALARANDISPRAWLRTGQRLRVENRHLVPAQLERGILINVPQRMLFLFRNGRVAAAYPVGLGRPSWPTQLGSYRVASREQDKTWFVPPSIQEEMHAEGKPVLTEVPPGPDNPLGKHWLGLDRIDCGIHGTIAPMSVYHFRSHGCMRLHPDDIAALYDQVRIGEPVEVIYRPVLLGATEDGRVLLEVNPDVYRRSVPPMQGVRALAAKQGLESRIDWSRAAQVVAAQEGLARDVGVAGPGEQGGAG